MSSTERVRFFRAVSDARDLTCKGMLFRAACERSAAQHNVPVVWVALEAGQAVGGSLRGQVALLRDRLEDAKEMNRKSKRDAVEVEDDA